MVNLLLLPFMEMLKSVKASPKESPKLSDIKSNEAKNFLAVEVMDEMKQGKVEKLVFSRLAGFDPQ